MLTLHTIPTLSFGLPKTGQTTEYAPGDDGTYQAGWVGDGSNRFTTLADVVIDRATNLMWPKDGDGAGLSWETWAGAITFCEGLILGGHSDWRLPNVSELFSLYNFGVSTYHMYLPPFVNFPTDYYWTGSTYPNSTDKVYAERFNGGVDFPVYTRLKTSNAFALAVRSI